MGYKLTKKNNQLNILVLSLFPATAISLIIVTPLNLVGVLFFALFFFITLFISATVSCFYEIYTFGKIGQNDYPNSYNRPIMGFIWTLLIFLKVGSEVIGMKKIKTAQGNIQKSIFYTLLVSLISVTPFVMIFTLLIYLFFS